MLPLNCNIRQHVGLFSFLVRKFQSSEDCSTSDSRKLDMGSQQGDQRQDVITDFLVVNIKEALLFAILTRNVSSNFSLRVLVNM